MVSIMAVLSHQIMKLFAFGHYRAIQFPIWVFIVLLCQSCATYHAQYGADAAAPQSDTTSVEKPIHTFYLIGDAGNSDQEVAKAGLNLFKAQLDRADENSTVLFLGDNIYPDGMPAEKKKGRAAAVQKLDNQIELVAGFKGKTIFIPGNHDWYHGLAGLKREADFVTAKLGKKSFLPKKGCGIDDIEISDDITLILIDSQWFITDWNIHPNMNDDCPINSRDKFFLELEDLINKNQTKTTIIALHHPVISNGTHGGQYSFAKNFFPVQADIPMPVIGTMVNILRKTSGLSPQDLQSKRYAMLATRVKGMVYGRENVILVSGHEHNLQYLEREGVKQIVSGAGSKKEAARATGPKDFSFGGNGFATIEIYKTGETNLVFWGVKGKELEPLFAKQLIGRKPKLKLDYPDKFPKTTSAAVYDESLLHKGAIYNGLWGKHYRDLYGIEVEAKTVDLDTLYGGLKPDIVGGGHQSLTLRLEDKAGRPYVLRGIKKSATRFLKTVAFKDKNVDFKNTYIEKFVFDFYTTVNPFTPFVMASISKSVGLYHTNPKLFYVPRQNALREFNREFGDALYMIEERPGKGFEKLASFGNADAILSTEDVIVNLHKDEKYKIDQRTYIRARLLDMILGDWDRHHDQWRWAEHKVRDSIVYTPIPRDHDQAFSKYDGLLLKLILRMPMLRHMQSFEDDIANVKWMNREAYALDLALLRTATKADWLAEAEYLKTHLTDQAIDEAFAQLPPELQDKYVAEIKSKLASRREKASKYATEYFEVLRNVVIIVGTDKKDKFQIIRSDDGKTRVKVSRLKKDGEEAISDDVYDAKETREIWIYGLDDDDVYEVSGHPRNPITIRLIGGLNHDSYTVKQGRKVRIYDFKSKENTFKIANARKVLTDSYELNTYNYERPVYNALSGFPGIGYNPDDGVKLGIVALYTVNGFERNPFSQKHTLKANYFFATNGYEIAYSGIFPSARTEWKFQFAAKMTSPNFAYNFFGYGNETSNPDDQRGMDYNRVKTQTFSVAPAALWNSIRGAFFSVQAIFESFEVDRTPDRFIETGIAPERVFETQSFAGLDVKYGFQNYDVPANPSLGMQFWIAGGYKINMAEPDRHLPYASGALGFTHPLVSSRKLVLATLAQAKMLFSDDFEFYQMATIGGDSDVRGFRNQRFSGKQSFFHTTDIRYRIGRVKNGILPLSLGLFAGFDYGRVWLDDEQSDKWHNSYGGGLLVSGIDTFTARMSYFQSSDGGRFAIGLGFGF
jgi:hypothetical protein